MSTIRLVGFAGLLVVAALVGGTIIGSVAASTLSHASSPDPVAPEPAAAASAPPAAAEYCAAFRRAFASNLGVDESALAPAAKAAAIAAIADAVADGRMTKAAGDRLTTGSRPRRPMAARSSPGSFARSRRRAGRPGASAWSAMASLPPRRRSA